MNVRFGSTTAEAWFSWKARQTKTSLFKGEFTGLSLSLTRISFKYFLASTAASVSRSKFTKMTLSKTVDKVKRALHRVKHLDTLLSSSTTRKTNANRNTSQSSPKQSAKPTNNHKDGKSTKSSHKNPFRIFKRSDKHQRGENANLFARSSPALSKSPGRDSAVILDASPKPPKSVVGSQATTIKNPGQPLNRENFPPYSKPKKPVSLVDKYRAILDEKQRIQAEAEALAELNEPPKRFIVIEKKPRKSVHFSDVPEVFYHHENHRPLNIGAAKITVQAKAVSDLIERERRNQRELTEVTKKQLLVLQKRLSETIFKQISKNPYAYGDLEHLQPEAFSELLSKDLYNDLIFKCGEVYENARLPRCLYLY